MALAVSVLYDKEPSKCILEWLPDPEDFVEALERQGYSAPAQGAAAPADEQACDEPVLAARLHNLALTMRLLTATFATPVRAAEPVDALSSKESTNI